MKTDAHRGGERASPAAAVPPAVKRWEQRRLTPMLEQYVAAKRQVGAALLLFRMGDFFELFFEDAEVAARELELTLTARDKGDDPIPMAGVPHHAIDNYVHKLVARGYCVALCDQVEDPREAKGIVRREITRLITPGTLSELDALEPTRHSYLAAATFIVHGREDARIALTLLDLLSGELLVTTLVDRRALADELVRMNVRELLLEERLAGTLDDDGRFADDLKRRAVRISAWPSEQQSDACASPLPQVPAAAPATCAAWQRGLFAVVRYAEHTQRRTLAHLDVPRAYALTHALVLDESTRRSLELTHTQMEGRKEGSLLAHLDCTVTALGARLLSRWLLMPLREQGAIARRADAVAALVENSSLRTSVRQVLREVYDIERLAGRVALERATPRDLAALGRSLGALPKVRALLAGCIETGALGCWHKLSLLESLAKKLTTALVELPPTTHTEGHIFARGYCSELDELLLLCEDAQGQIDALEAEERRASGIASLKVRYNRVFGYFLEVTRAQLAQVPAHYVRRQTLVNAERYTTPQLAGFEERMLGARHRRVAREAALFEQLREEVRTHLVALKDIARTVAETDALAALAETAERHRYVRPTLVDEPVLALEGARHPVLETRMPSGEPFVPNDIRLDASREQLMLLTGPNMAGKSTVMRQAALAVVMAQMGGFVAASRAVIGLCDRLFTRVGAQDHLGAGQSTFMVEMCETAAILAQATTHSLVLLDEVGRGTSTYDGVSIAWAVAEHLHEVNGCRTLFATHYHELTALAETYPRVVNARMAIAERNDGIAFLRQLELGAAQRSYGIEVARLAELPASVLERARQLLAGYERKAAEPVPARARIEPKPQPPRCGHEELAALLADIEVDATTPLEALALLARLKAELCATAPRARPKRTTKALRRPQAAMLPFDGPTH